VVPVAGALWFAQNGFDVERSRRQVVGLGRRLRLVGPEGAGSDKGGKKGGAKAAAAPAPAAPVVVETKAPAKKGWW